MSNMSKKKKRFVVFPAYSDRLVLIGTMFLALFGCFMIASAEMGSSAGNYSIIISSVVRQSAFVLLGTIAMIIFSRRSVFAFNEHFIIDIGFWVVLGLLLMTRLFGSVGGAYAWIRFGSYSIQPSEFAKVYVIVAYAKLLGRDYGPETNKKNFIKLLGASIIYAVIIAVYQKDFGSAIVLFGISYVLLMIVSRKEFRVYQFRMLIILFAVIGLALFLLSPVGTSILENFGGYKVGRFLSSADPFKYQYDSGYHLVMSLVSFATGGLFGLGYGKSIHKYMNFPNPSNDFILPVIVEEMGLVFGFIPILIMYGMVLVPLARYALKTTNIREKIVFVGTLMYFVLHFALNVGGVSGLIPLTGVPLLLLSSGGSSTLASMMAIGIAESEIVRYRKNKLQSRGE